LRVFNEYPGIIFFRQEPWQQALLRPQLQVQPEQQL
jgi:hypothetical protein